MSNEDPNPKRYSEEEFALVLRRASELQETPGKEGAKPRSGGFTLEEMQSIAREAGIDEEAVTRAAAVLGATEWEEEGGLARIIVGGTGKYHLEHEIPGTLPPEERGRVLEVIRRVWEHQGEASEVVGGFEWKTSRGELSVVSVNVTPRGKRTSIQIVGNRDGAGALTFIFPMAASAVLIGALGGTFEPTSAVGIVSLVTGLLGTGFLTARTIWTRGTKKFRTRMTKLMEAVSREVEDAAVLPGPEQEALPAPTADPTKGSGDATEPPGE